MLELKHTEIKNAFNELVRSLDTSEDRISVLEGLPTEANKGEKKKKTLKI